MKQKFKKVVNKTGSFGYKLSQDPVTWYGPRKTFYGKDHPFEIYYLSGRYIGVRQVFKYDGTRWWIVTNKIGVHGIKIDFSL